MRRIVERLAEGAEGTPGATLTLAFDARRKSRQRVRLDDGQEAALLLERGTVLRDGDRLRADDGLVVAVAAAPETLSAALSDDPLALARAAYHLGNRHVPVQVTPGRLSYQHDHVLDDMVRGLGLEVRVLQTPFQPEPGAYGGGHKHAHEHAHAHAHEHAHAHAHDHDHDHEHAHDHDHDHER